MPVVIETSDLKAYYALEIDGVKQYVRALDEVSLTVVKDEILGIAGESGCGKSTLIKALYGLVHPPLTIMGGKVFYNIDDKNVDILSLDNNTLRRMRWIVNSYIPQGSMSVLNPTVKIKSQFLDIIKAHQKDVNEKETENLIEKHIQELGLPVEVLDSYPHQLSGGMRQRTVIALATILKPKVIFADEPTTALDVIVQRGVIQMLSRVRELGSTLIVVTHSMGVHAHITDRIIIMYAGKIVEVAYKEEMFENPLHPYTRYLIGSIPKIGDKSRSGDSISGLPPSLLNPPSGCRFHPRCPIAKAICREKTPPLTEVESNHCMACHTQE